MLGLIGAFNRLLGVSTEFYPNEPLGVLLDVNFVDLPPGLANIVYLLLNLNEKLRIFF